MAELRDVASDVVYRPLSGLALGGFALSCLFGGIVALSAGIAVVQGAPFFFPNWTLFVAAAGFIVSWWGLSDVRNSEGTKAGQKLATYGMWISLISGTGYFAYSHFTGLALAQQSMAFFMDEEVGFFTHLRKAGQNPDVELNRAFLLSLPPSDRGQVNPADLDRMALNFDKPDKDGGPGGLTRFRSDHLVRSISKGGDTVSIQPLGVHGWKYEQRSYHVTCQFRIKTLEANAEFSITARSAEPEAEGQGRQWFVDMTSLNHKSLQRTPYGEGMLRLRNSAIAYSQTLESTIRTQGSKVGEFTRLDKTDWSKFEPGVRQELKTRLKDIFDGTDAGIDWHFQAGKEGMINEWEFDAKGRLILTMPLILVLGEGKQQYARRGELALIVQTKEAVNPEKMGSVETPERIDWELLHMKAVRTNLGARK